ncbi:MAG TPA: hypothetical protein VGH21_05205, partial [Solirubrobacteraceae bacterium]
MRLAVLTRAAVLAALAALVLPPATSLAASQPSSVAAKHATERRFAQRGKLRKRKHKRGTRKHGGVTHGAGGEDASRGLVVVPRSATRPDLSYLKLEGTPGQIVQAGAIELLNPGNRTIRAVLAPVDSRTLDTLGSAYAPATAALHGSSRWLMLGARSVTLAPQAHTLVNIAVRFPASATPGERLSGVSVEEVGQRAREGSTGDGAATASVVRYAIGVETSLPGARRPRLRFLGASVGREPAGLAFTLKARNAGNVILQGVHGSVRVLRGGHTVVSRSIPAGTFLSQTSIAYPVPAFEESPPEGTRYRVQAVLRYPGGIARLNESVTFGHRAALA